MNIFKSASLCGLVLCSVAACNRGFELDSGTTIDEETADRIFIGSNEDASWELLIDDDSESFTLQNKTSPSSTTSNYSINGSYNINDDGWLELQLFSPEDETDEIDTEIAYAIEVGDHAIVVHPFTNVDDEWLVLIDTTDGCPGSNVTGVAMMLNRPSDASSAAIGWIWEYTYDDDDEEIEYDHGVALDENFTVQNPILNESDSCVDGYAELSHGDQYFGEDSTLIEVDTDLFTDGDTRAFGLPNDDLDSVTDIGSLNYVGMVRDFGGSTDAYRVTAMCVSGQCDIFASDVSVLQLNLEEDNINYDNIGGVITASLDDAEGILTSTRAVCFASEEIDDEDEDEQQKFIMCTAQSLSDNSAPLQIMLSSIEEEDN